jgi:hypothetical protein
MGDHTSLITDAVKPFLYDPLLVMRRKLEMVECENYLLSTSNTDLRNSINMLSSQNAEMKAKLKKDSGDLDDYLCNHIGYKYMDWVNHCDKEELQHVPDDEKDDYLTEFHQYAFNDDHIAEFPDQVVEIIGSAETMMHIASEVNNYEHQHGYDHDTQAHGEDMVKHFQLYCYFRGEELIQDYDFDSHEWSDSEEDIPNPPPAPPAPPEDTGSGDGDDSNNGDDNNDDNNDNDNNNDDNNNDDDDEEEEDPSPTADPAYPVCHNSYAALTSTIASDSEEEYKYEHDIDDDDDDDDDEEEEKEEVEHAFYGEGAPDCLRCYPAGGSCCNYTKEDYTRLTTPS